MLPTLPRLIRMKMLPIRRPTTNWPRPNRQQSHWLPLPSLKARLAALPPPPTPTQQRSTVVRWFNELKIRHSTSPPLPPSLLFPHVTRVAIPRFASTYDGGAGIGGVDRAVAVKTATNQPFTLLWTRIDREGRDLAEFKPSPSRD